MTSRWSSPTSCRPVLIVSQYFIPRKDWVYSVSHSSNIADDTDYISTLWQIGVYSDIMKEYEFRRIHTAQGLGEIF